MNESILSSALLGWFSAHGRDLPWRRTYDPYHVWISEIMAQQTQMSRAVSFFERWVERFPSICDVARADEDSVLKQWEGLGYYSRARNIRKAARLICEQHEGVFPRDFQDILSLPGVGEYTAGAIASIAFNLQYPCVDANVKRVFSRLFDLDYSFKSSALHKGVARLMREHIPEGRAREFNQAVMEFGQLVCSKRPDCSLCPICEHCRAFSRDTVLFRPVMEEAVKPMRIDMASGFLLHEGKVLIQKRRADDVWPGLWEFPGGVIEKRETPEQAVVREYREEVALAVRPVEKIGVVRFCYTRYRVTLHGFLCELANGDSWEPVFHEAQEGGFVAPVDLGEFAFPSGHRKLLETMRADVRYSSLFLK